MVFPYSPVELGLDPEKIGMKEIFAPFNSKLFVH